MIPIIDCLKCKYLKEKMKCLAFPDGIPNDIISGKVSHKKPHKNDNGIQFEENKTLKWI